MIDASAIVAIMLGEAESGDLFERLLASPRRFTHPVSIYEAALAVSRVKQRPAWFGREQVEIFRDGAGLECIAIGMAETSAALDAFERYGKGRHPAGLNMGDCFSYACARLRAMPLLYKGEDFAGTDIPAA